MSETYGTYHKIKGYFIFYEQNRKMQAYLSDEFKEDRVEKESFPDRAIKSFREKVRIKSERKSGSMLKMASSFFVVTVLAVAAVTVTKMDDLKKVRQTLNTSDNAAENEAQDHIYMDTAGMGEDADLVAGGQNSEESTGKEEQNGTENTAAGTKMGLETGTAGSAENAADELAENTAAGAMESSMENTGKAAENNTGSTAADGMENTAGTAIADESGTMENDIVLDGTESASDAITGGNMTASNGLAAAQSSVSSAAARDTEKSLSARTRRTQATYTIREGDTLADICSFDKLDLICSVNGITDANLILPGQKIVLP